MGLTNENLTAPLSEGTYLQRLASYVTKIRDHHIVQQIFQALSHYKRVLVVYGCSHYAIQRNVLIKYLENPIYMIDRKSLMRLK